MAERRKRVFSGIQPSGVSHIGNYLGAIRNWVTQQEDFDNLFCIVNLHAITLPTEPESLRANTITMANTLLAAGIDPEGFDSVRAGRRARALRALLAAQLCGYLSASCAA